MTPLQDILWRIYYRQFAMGGGRSEELEVLIEGLDSPDILPGTTVAVTEKATTDFDKGLRKAQEEEREKRTDSDMDEGFCHKPCPFCGHNGYGHVSMFIGARKEWAIECLGCGARGPTAEEGQEDAMWNDRATKKVFVVLEPEGTPLKIFDSFAAADHWVKEKHKPPYDGWLDIEEWEVEE